MLSSRERDFVESARALDLGTGHIIFREIMPNMASYLAVSLIFAMTAAAFTPRSAWSSWVWCRCRGRIGV